MNIFSKIRERIRNEREDGVALITLIGVSMIVFVILGTITTSATLSVYNTNMDLSQKQARNNAESALDIAEASYESAISYYGFDEEVGYDTRNFCQHGYETADYSFKFYSTDRSAMPTSVDTPGMRPGCPTLDDTWYMIEGKGKGNNNRTSTLTRTYKNIDYDRKFTLGNIALIADRIEFNGANNTTVKSSPGINVNPVSLLGTPTCNTPDGFETKLITNVQIDSEFTQETANCHIIGDASFSTVPDAEVSVTGDSCFSRQPSENTNQFSNNERCRYNLGYSVLAFYGYDIPENFDNPTHNVVIPSNKNHMRSLVQGSNDLIIDVRNVPNFQSEAYMEGTYNVQSDIVVLLDSSQNYTLRNFTVDSNGNEGSLSFVTDLNPFSSGASTTIENVHYTEEAAGVFMLLHGGDVEVQNSTFRGSFVSSAETQFSGTQDITLSYYPVELPMEEGSVVYDANKEMLGSYEYLSATPSVRVN